MFRKKGYKYITKIDLSIFLYLFELDEESKELCTIVTPYGKFHYNRLPMGVKVCPDISQSLIKKIMDGLDVEAYIDDCAHFSDDSFDKHLKVIDKILHQLKLNGLKCNPLKCE